MFPFSSYPLSLIYYRWSPKYSLRTNVHLSHGYQWLSISLPSPLVSLLSPVDNVSRFALQFSFQFSFSLIFVLILIPIFDFTFNDKFPLFPFYQLLHICSACHSFRSPLPLLATHSGHFYGDLRKSKQETSAGK